MTRLITKRLIIPYKGVTSHDERIAIQEAIDTHPELHNATIVKNFIENEDNGTFMYLYYEYYGEYSIDKFLEDYFPIIHASTLSCDDSFLSYCPKNEEEALLKEQIIEAINSGLSDFRAQIHGPRCNSKNKICYDGAFPTYGHAPFWWSDQAYKLLPEKHSRLGTSTEMIAFIALFIKELIENNGYEIDQAWNAVCTEYKKLENYDGVWKRYFDGHSKLTTASGKMLLYFNRSTPIAKSFEPGWWTHHEGLSMGYAWIVCDV